MYPGRPNSDRAQGDQLGIIIPESVTRAVSGAIQNAISAIVGLVDPGQKRDANRRARADMWFNLANLGSITAARRLHGGSQVQYTQEERNLYRDRWNQLVASKPDLAQQALALGDLGVPEPGSGLEPPSLPPAMIEDLKQEIAVYQGGGTPASSGGTSGNYPVPATVQPTPDEIAQAGMPKLFTYALVGGVLYAFLKSTSRRR